MVTKQRIKEGWTQIQIKKDTTEALKKHGWMGATYDDVIIALLKKVEGKG